MKLSSVPLSKIKGSVYQPRQSGDLRLERMARSLLANGLKNPLVLQPHGRDKYRLVCGHRRYEALKILTKRGTEEIPKGMAHSPINFKKVDKPIIYCSIYMAQEYVKKPA